MQFMPIKKMFATHCLTAMLCIVPLSAFSETLLTEPAEALSSVLKSYGRFSADFEQITRTDQSTESEISKGEMQIERPGKFRWETITPFPQLIVSDGDNVWIYDPDLEQATRKPVNPEDTNGAALILNGNIDELQTKFDITIPVNDENTQLFDLKPKSDQSSFQRIRIYFSNGVMSELMLQDVLGQQTTIVLHNPIINPSFSDSLFDFSPPDGVDVIISDQM